MQSLLQDAMGLNGAIDFTWNYIGHNLMGIYHGDSDNILRI